MSKPDNPSKDPRPIAVLGLGRFGQRIAGQLSKAGQAVIACDRERDAVERLAQSVAQAIVVDVTDEAALKARGVHKVKAAVVAIGEDFEASVLATVIMKHMEVPRIIARARSSTTAQVLRRVGASVVVLAEDEAADRWAARLLGPGVLNQIEFHEGHSIVEFLVPKPWVGKSLAELGVRQKHGIHIVAVKREDKQAPSGVRIVVLPPAEPLLETDVLIVMGQDENLKNLTQLG
ncbi:MAG: potassium channel family protein [Phycisphaerales bacterium JB060]